MTLTYTTGDHTDVRGACGHRHQSVEAALACMERDSRYCHASGGYSDRSRITRSDGSWTTRVDIEMGRDWRQPPTL